MNQKAIASSIDSFNRWPVLLAVGLATGIFSGLLGIGGAAILVPSLVGIAGLTQHRAHGTSLAVIIPTALSGTINYALRGQIDWLLVLVYSASAVGGAVIGASFMPRVPARDLKRLFGIFLLIVAARMLLPAPAGTETSLDLANPMILIGSIALGLFAGICSGLLGIGGGQILVPGMIFLFAVDQRLAQGVSLAFIVPTALSGALTHYRNGNVVVRAALLIAPTSIIGAQLGGEIAHRVDLAVLKVLFGLFLVYAGGRMLFGNPFRRAGKAATQPGA